MEIVMKLSLVLRRTLCEIHIQSNNIQVRGS